MPPPAAYIDLTSETFPYTRTITATEFNSGTYGNGSAPECWFKYTPSVEIGLGMYVEGNVGASNTFAPCCEVYESDAMTLVVNNLGTGSYPATGNGKAWWYPMQAGVNYWIKVRDLDNGNTDLAFDVNAETLPVDPASIPTGSFIINDDQANNYALAYTSAGVPLALLSALPAGETGDVLPSGVQLFSDRFGLYGSKLALFAANLTLTSAFDTTTSLGSAHPAICNDGTQFYVVNRSPGGAGQVYTVSAAGVVAGPIATLPTADINAVGVSSDGTILYYCSAYANGKVYRWDLVNDVALPDLYTDSLGDDPFAYMAVTRDANPGEIIVLNDGSIVTWAYDYDTDNSRLLHIAADGTLLHSYDYTAPLNVDHLTHSPDNETTVVVWFHTTATGSQGKIETIALSTGVASTSFTFAQFANKQSKRPGDPTIFGFSESCFITTSGGYAAASGGDGPTVYPDTLGIDGSTPDCCDQGDAVGGTTPSETEPPPTGEYPSIIFSCTGGGLPDTVADLPAPEVW